MAQMVRIETEEGHPYFVNLDHVLTVHRDRSSALDPKDQTLVLTMSDGDEVCVYSADLAQRVWSYLDDQAHRFD